MVDLKDPRVLFAAQRTLLAWNRTSLALIAFGFLVERAGLLLQAVSPQHASQAADLLTFWLGLAFIALGVFSSAYASRQYLSLLKSVSPADFPPGYGGRVGVWISAAVAILGAGLALALFLGRI